VGNNAMDNMNVRIGVNNVYAQNIQYSYENYLETFQSDNAINGGLQRGLNNGLISQVDWESSYGYRVDVSRMEKVNDNAQQQITVLFTNNSAFTMDYLCLVFYEKNMILDCEQGKIAV